MTTVQEAPNGHSPFPPPCSFPDSQDQNRSKDSTDNNSAPTQETESFAAGAYHVPPAGFAPRLDAYRNDDSLHWKVPDILPERCQFMFSDGRQCTMARSEIHPSLCRFHSEREEQLFGDPVAGGHVVGRQLDLPELYSACRDLTTPAGVHRALAQVFRLLAQRRISRQEAATFAKLGQLLLQSLSAPRSSCESPAANVYLPPQKGYQPRRNVYQQDELSPLNKVELFAGNKVNQELSRVNSSRESHGDQELSRVNKVSKVPADQTHLRRERHGDQELRGVNKVEHQEAAPITAFFRHEEVEPDLTSALPVPPWKMAPEPAGHAQAVPVQNQHLCGVRPQPAQNEHLQNVDT